MWDNLARGLNLVFHLLPNATSQRTEPSLHFRGKDNKPDTSTDNSEHVAAANDLLTVTESGDLT